MTPAQRRRRNLDLAAARKRGVPVRALARIAGLTPAAVRRILDDLEREAAEKSTRREIVASLSRMHS